MCGAEEFSWKSDGWISLMVVGISIVFCIVLHRWQHAIGPSIAR